MSSACTGSRLPERSTMKAVGRLTSSAAGRDDEHLPSGEDAVHQLRKEDVTDDKAHRRGGDEARENCRAQPFALENLAIERLRELGVRHARSIDGAVSHRVESPVRRAL